MAIIDVLKLVHTTWANEIELLFLLIVNLKSKYYYHRLILLIDFTYLIDSLFHIILFSRCVALNLHLTCCKHDLKLSLNLILTYPWPALKPSHTLTLGQFETIWHCLRLHDSIEVSEVSEYSEFHGFSPQIHIYLFTNKYISTCINYH